MNHFTHINHCACWILPSLHEPTCDTLSLCYYRPQRSCSKVMFSQASVILFIGGVSGRHPPGADTPQADTRQADTPRQTPPRQQTATEADGTHPTGMHSCFYVFSQTLTQTLMYFTCWIPKPMSKRCYDVKQFRKLFNIGGSCVHAHWH